MGVYCALVLLVAILAGLSTYLGSANDLSVLNLTNILNRSSLNAMTAVAMTVVLLSGSFDLSVARVAALAAVLLIGNADALGFWPAAALALAGAMAVGLRNGAIVQLVGINAVIVTRDAMTAGRGLILIDTDGGSLSVTDPGVVETMKALEGGRVDAGWAILLGGAVLPALGFAGLLRSRSQGRALTASQVGMTVGGALLLLVAALTRAELELRSPVNDLVLLSAIVGFVLTFTMVGRRLCATGANTGAARPTGIDVTRCELIAFASGSGTAGLAGFLAASRLRSINPPGLTGAELPVIAAAIPGGTSRFGGAGSVIQTLAGALLLVTLTSGFKVLNLGADWPGLIEGIVAVADAAIYRVGGRAGRPRAGG